MTGCWMTVKRNMKRNEIMLKDYLLLVNNSYAYFSEKDKIQLDSTKKGFLVPSCLRSSQLHGFTGKRVRAPFKKTGILKFYSDNP